MSDKIDKIKVLNLGKGVIQASEAIEPGKGATLDKKEAEGLMRMYPKTVVDAEKFMNMKIDDSEEVKKLKDQVAKLEDKLKNATVDVDVQKALSENVDLKAKVKELEAEIKILTEELEKATAPALPGVGGNKDKDKNKNK